MISSHRAEAIAIVNYFYPRFENWWDDGIKKNGQTFASKIEALLQQRKISEPLSRFAHFYQAENAKNSVISMNLFYRPDLVKEASSGQQIQNYSAVEFTEKEEPSDRLDVIIHELCHYLFASSTDENFKKLHDQFSNSTNPVAIATFNLMNEALATAFGNGIINKILMSKERWSRYSAHENSFYNDIPIDQSAKALQPWLENWLESGKTLYDPQFVGEYISRLEQKLGDTLNSPKLQLKEMFLLTDKKYKGEFAVPVRRALKVGSQYTTAVEWSDPQLAKEVEKMNDLNTVIVVHPDNFNQLQKHNLITLDELKSLKKAYKTDNYVLYSLKRPKRYVVIVAGKDYDDAIRQVEKMPKLAKGFDGNFNKEL
jgi:hypothetical protein